ncbi:cupin domain-containing protein [Micromonospora coerulea]|uniref:cupin domain-containing protein n=1 Tax=Micromonospora coerulea TaxID=47856 RepID=UPI0019076064|nr:cupin domain-containing protein [Micromonospora veneta]
MKITRAAEQAGTAGKPGSQFTGDVWNYLTMPATDGVTINTVTFSPCARTYWHSHEHGQILQVVAGRGLICTAGEQPEVLRAGDTVWVPAGERHWHGAAPDAVMTHTAISLGKTEWAEAVADGEYPAAGTTSARQ